MSKARVCDNCGEVLTVDDKGEDENGELYAWLRVGTLDGDLTQDACSRSCAVELLADDGPLAEAVDARLEGISKVIRAINGEDDDEESEPEDDDE